VGPATAGRDGAILTVDGVGVRLGGRDVLRDVSFALHPGELTGLIGPNGAGKTTLLRVILGLQAHDSGAVHHAPPPDGASRRVIGYVPQKVALDPDMPMRARDVVALGIDGNRLGIPVARRRRRELVDRMLDQLGATHLADERVGTLSGGEAQRILIAHALVGRPRLLLLDEPLANLDLRAEQDVVELLARIARQEQLAILISAHDINPLLPVTDRIVYVANGRAASGTTEEVVRSEVLSALYGQHVDVLRVHDRILVVAGTREDGEHHPRRDQAEPGIAALP
jgi:zinc/manganese transport system ATP-binding protein